jgi:hypothetical protein
MKLTIELTKAEYASLAAKAEAEGSARLDEWARRRLLEAVPAKPVCPAKVIRRFRSTTPGAGEY